MLAIERNQIQWLRRRCTDLTEKRRDLPAMIRAVIYDVLKHLVKQRIQPDRGGASWRRSITEGRSEILYKLDDSPSLRRYAEQNLQKIYRRAVKDALFETNLAGRAKALDIPSLCPYTLDDLLEADLNASDSR